MEEPVALYRKFRDFLDDFLIRKAGGNLDPEDFDDSKFEYISLHLEKILPTVSLTEAMRIQDYFNDLLIFNLTGEIEKPDEQPEHETYSPSPISAGERFQSSLPLPLSVEEQAMSEPSIPSIHKRRIDPIAGSTPQSAPTHAMETETSIEFGQQEYGGSTISSIPQRRTAPIAGSTPLSAAVFATQGTEREDEFVADIISQLNLSPIPQATAPPPSPDENAEPCSHLANSLPSGDPPFLRSLVKAIKNAEKSREAELPATPRRAQLQQRISYPRRLPFKEKRKRTDLEQLCFAALKQKTEEQVRRAEEFFLHFAMLPGKTRNLIARVTNKSIIPQGKAGHILAERCVNVSNILRAHASQRQSSIEQPPQVSVIRSPSTSQSIGFTPLRGEVVPSQSPVNEIQQSFPMRLMLRQQPLVSIPERDSVIPMPLSPQLEDILPDNSLLPADLSMIPLPATADMSLPENLLVEAPIDIEMTPQQLGNSNVPTSLTNVTTTVASNEILPQPEQQPSAAPEQPLGDDPIPVSWFEILRPRAEINYPQVTGERRRRRKRRIETDEQVGEPPQNVPVLDSTQRSDFPNVPENFAMQVTETPVQSYVEEDESELICYFDLLKEAGQNVDYRSWRCFDPYLFVESDRFEMYTYIYKRMIEDDFIEMDTLYKEGTTRLEAAKGFRLILELKTMGLIEIIAIDTRIKGFKFKATVGSDS